MQVGSGDAEQRLTTREAMKELSWFPQVFAAAISAPSILSILEMIFKDHRLTAALQWIVDGYHQVTALMGAILEPVFAPAIAWVNATFGWHLVLYPHWRPLFLLGMVFLVAGARTGWRERHYRTAIDIPGRGAFGLLLGAMLAGLVPLGGNWWQQGLIAALPLAMVFRVYGFEGVGIRTWSLVFIVLPFSIAAALTLAPTFARTAGMLTMAGVVILIGLALVAIGLSKNNVGQVRIGLTTLGGFITAGLVLAADAAIRAFDPILLH